MSYTTHRSLVTQPTNTAARKETQPMHTSTRLHLGIRALLALLLTLALLPLLTPAPARAAGFMVTTLVDSGDGSLREAIELANATLGADTITFNLSGMIKLASTLPAIDDELTIDGNGQMIAISGDNKVQVIVVNTDKTLNLNALTVMNGYGCGGGGIYNGAGTVNITNSTFAGNVSNVINGCAGGGAFNSNGIMNVTNSTFNGNSADFGGAIHNNGLMLNVTNSTFSNNSGDGINDNVGTATLRNTLVVNSVGPNCAGTITDGGSNLQFGGSTADSCGATIPTPAADPLGGNTLANNGGSTQTIALLPGSAAIDAGDDGVCEADPVNHLDQRGVERPQDGNGDGTASCDIGAFELQLILRFSGFFQPIDNLPTINSVKAGQAIPVKFSLGGNYGLNIFASGYPKVQQVACSSSTATDEVEQTVTAGASGLSYDAATSTYSYTWKTDKKWAGTCRQLVLKLVDGSEHIASFTFK
jgi:hypothetical protein